MILTLQFYLRKYGKHLKKNPFFSLTSWEEQNIVWPLLWSSWRGDMARLTPPLDSPLTVYKTIVSDQPILAPSHLIWRNTSQMRLEVRNSGEMPQQNEQPDSVDQSALIVSNAGRRPASFIKRPASFIKGTVPGRKRSSNLLKRLRKIFEQLDHAQQRKSDTTLYFRHKFIF